MATTLPAAASSLASSASAFLARAAERAALTARERLHPGTVEFWMPLLPVVLYWLVAGAYDLIDSRQHPWTERRRLRKKAEADARNPVTRAHVVGRVLLQHAVQCAVAWANTLVDPQFCDARPRGSLLKTAGQFALCMVVFDGWQYMIHRLMHESKALYNAVHSTHHRLLVCYAAGALYNHPLEAFLLDTVGALATVYASGAPCDVATAFFCFATVKTVTDHCGYDWPVNPLAPLFRNNARYHDVHHDGYGGLRIVSTWTAFRWVVSPAAAATLPEWASAPASVAGGVDGSRLVGPSPAAAETPAARVTAHAIRTMVSVMMGTLPSA